MAEGDFIVSNDKDDALKNGDDDMTLMSLKDNLGCVYGKLVLLGYNGTFENSNTYAQGRKHHSKMILRKRHMDNGIKKDQSSLASIPPTTQVVRDASRHVVSYSYNHCRSSEEQIDFTVVDTWLAANALHQGVQNELENGLLEGIRVAKDRRCNIRRPISSTISRYMPVEYKLIVTILIELLYMQLDLTVLRIFFSEYFYSIFSKI